MELGKTMTINRFAVFGAALATVLVFSTAQAASKYYKWTDASGVVHYGENPPDPGKATRINVNVGSSSEQDKAADALEESRAKAANAGQQAASDPEKEKVAEENARIVKENCEIYRQNLSALKNSARIRERDAKGEYRYLTDEEKAARETSAETYLKENCQ